MKKLIKTTQLKLQKLLRLKPRLPIYGKRTLKLAFEFGLVLSETSRDMKIELTKDIVYRAEEVFIKEIKANGINKTAINFIPLILAVLELK